MSLLVRGSNCGSYRAMGLTIATMLITAAGCTANRRASIINISDLDGKDLSGSVILHLTPEQWKQAKGGSAESAPGQNVTPQIEVLHLANDAGVLIIPSRWCRIIPVDTGGPHPMFRIDCEPPDAPLGVDGRPIMEECWLHVLGGTTPIETRLACRAEHCDRCILTIQRGLPDPGGLIPIPGAERYACVCE